MRPAIRSAVMGLALGLISGSVFFGGSALAQSVAPSSVSLKGVLQDESGKPLTHAIITAVPTVLPAAVTGSKPTGTGSTNPVVSGSIGTEITGPTDAQGNFSLAGIPAGKYTICVRDLDSAHLDPCFWSAGTQVDMSNGKGINGQQAQVTSAATLQVRIDDPLKLSNPQAGQFETLVAVILPNGKLAPMNLVTSEPTGKTFQLAVPVGSYKVFVKSNYFTIADGTGTLIDDKDAGNGYKFPPTVNAPVSITSGMSYVELKITGKR